MKKLIDLPAKRISKLKSVHINLDMTGYHYEQLTTFNGKCQEQLMLSILSDLVDEDVSLLTRQEAIYLFALVRIANIGSKIPIRMECPHCGASVRDYANLSDVKINDPDKDFEIKKMNWKFNGVDKEFTIEPYPLALEVKFLDWLSVYKDITRDDIYNDDEKTLKYKMYTNLLHLNYDGKPVFDDVEMFEQMDDILKENTYQNVGRLYYLANEVDSFGIVPNVKKISCTNKECSGKFAFHIPVLYGLCPVRKSH